MKVVIKDYNYEIIECGNDDARFYKDGEIILFGEVDYIRQEIRLYKHLTYRRKREALIHELTHAFLDAYMGGSHIKGEYNEEDLCCFMSAYSEDIIKITDRYMANSEVT